VEDTVRECTVSFAAFFCKQHLLSLSIGRLLISSFRTLQLPVQGVLRCLPTRKSHLHWIRKTIIKCSFGRQSHLRSIVVTWLAKRMAWQPNKGNPADLKSPRVTKIDICTWNIWIVLLYHEKSLSKSDKGLGDSGNL
jgi:hypothetical protein